MSGPALRESFFQVALIQPEIPANTGNIGRSCLAFQSGLHLVRPLGFDISDKQLKRAGLDYWPLLQKRVYKNFEHWLAARPPAAETWLFSVRGGRSLYETRIQKGSALVFGSETSGLSAGILSRFPNQILRIPFPGPAVRSLNLANAVSIALFEAWRGLQANPAAPRAPAGR